MTREQKFIAILERIQCRKPLHSCDDPMGISIMIIISYFDHFEKLGLIESPYHMTDMGRMVASIADEFAWTPSDEEILKFVTDMVEESDQEGILFMLKRYRDNKEKLMEDVKKAKNI